MKPLTIFSLLLGVFLWTLPAKAEEVHKICTDTQTAITGKKEKLDQLSSQNVELSSDLQDLTDTLDISKVRESIHGRQANEAHGILHGHVASLDNLIVFQRSSVGKYEKYLTLANQVATLANEIVAEFNKAKEKCNVDSATIKKWEKLAQEQTSHIQEMETNTNKLKGLLKAHENLKLVLESEMKGLR